MSDPRPWRWALLLLPSLLAACGGGAIAVPEAPDASDEEALAAFRRLARTEGILPALEPSHALARVADLDEELVLVCLSGRGDKDLEEVLRH